MVVRRPVSVDHSGARRQDFRSGHMAKDERGRVPLAGAGGQTFLAAEAEAPDRFGSRVPGKGSV